MSGTKARKLAIALGMACIVLIVGISGVVAYCTFQSSNKVKIASATETISQWTSAVADQNTMTFLDPNTSEVLDHWNQIQTSQLDRFNHLTLFWFEQFITLLNSTSMTEGTADGLLLTMTLKPLYRLGDTINIALEFNNLSNQTATFGVVNPLANQDIFNFEVYDDTNSTAYSSLWPPNTGGVHYLPPTLPIIFVIPVDPGQSLNTELSWQQEGWSTNVLPGTYYIVGQIGSLDDGEFNVALETSPMQITILPF